MSKQIVPKLFRLRSTPDGWDLMMDLGDGNGIVHFPYVVVADPGPVIQSVTVRSHPMLTVTIPCERLEVEHELRRTDDE